MSYPTNPLDALDGGGAFEIGSDWGQNWTDAAIKQLWQVPTPTSGNALDLLEEQLSKLPLDALKTFAPLIGLDEEDFDNVSNAVAFILAALDDVVEFLRLDDWQAFLDQIVDSAEATVEDAVAWWNQIIADAEDFWDNLVNGLGGYSTVENPGQTSADALDAAYAQAAQVAALNQWVADIQAETASTAGNGVSVVVNFGEAPDASSLPDPPFENYMLGSGTSQWSISGGKTVWAWTAGDATREQFSFLDTPTTGASSTTYQRLGILAMTACPNGIFGQHPSYGMIIRANSSYTSFGVLKIGKEFCELWHYAGVSDSSPTLIGSLSSFSGKAGAAYWIEASGTSNLYKVYENTTLLGTITDGSNVLGTTDAYNYGGIYGKFINNGVSYVPPGYLGAFVLVDNKPPDYPGTGGKMVRTSTGTVNVSATTAALPTNFYQAEADVSPDITADLVNGTFTVSRSGRYTLVLRTKISTISSGFIAMVLRVDRGSGQATYHHGGTAAGNYLGVSTPAVEAVWVNVPLAAGDIVQAGYWASNATTGALTGDSNGYESHFSIALTSQPTSFAA